MAYPIARIIVGVAIVTGLTACGGGSGQNQSLLRTIGLRQPPPDEFLVIERKPLEMPADRKALPLPEPGGINRVDPQPRREATAILAGTDATATRTSGELSPGETALLSSARSSETEPDIRTTLAAEDKELDASSGRFGLTTVFGVKTSDPYKEDTLDPFEETRRLRREGVETPASPEKAEEKPGTLF